MLNIEEHKKAKFKVLRAVDTAVSNTAKAIGFASAELVYIIATPMLLHVKSTDGDDSGAVEGTGARTVIIEGARRAGEELTHITETVTLIGTGYAKTKYQYSEVYSVTVDEYGSSGKNEGDVSVAVKVPTGYQSLFIITAGEGSKANSLFTSPSDMKMKQLNVFINAVDGDHIDFTSVFFDIKIKKIPLLDTGKYETLGLDPDTGVGTTIGRYMFSGGTHSIELYESLKPSDIIYLTAQNITNTDTYRVSVEVVLYETLNQ